MILLIKKYSVFQNDSVSFKNSVFWYLHYLQNQHTGYPLLKVHAFDQHVIS